VAGKVAREEIKRMTSSECENQKSEEIRGKGRKGSNGWKKCNHVKPPPSSKVGGRIEDELIGSGSPRHKRITMWPLGRCLAENNGNTNSPFA
jgi:hypothetical protein